MATIDLEGVISPVTLRLIGLAIDRAQAERAQALVVQLDTPGGLERSMRSIVQRMMNAEVPVIVFVGPTGARAASAGVFITMAAHVAAMAPATNIGAASPVAIGGNADKTMMKKIENDAAAFIRTVALERGRNADWAEKAVRQAVSITEREAVKLKVVDLVADSVPDLLEKLDGRTVKLAKGTTTLATKGAPVRPIEIGFRDRFLNVITDPNVAYVLMMLGMLGLFFELSNPGVILPGVIGGISLILAFFAFQSLPINYAGLLLILFGIVLLVAEIKVVSHGVLAIGGVVSMALGSLMLFDAPEVGLPRLLVGDRADGGGDCGALPVRRHRGCARPRRPRDRAPKASSDSRPRSRERLAPDGQVMVAGEIWRAIAQGEAVERGRAGADPRGGRAHVEGREGRGGCEGRGQGRRRMITVESLVFIVVVIVALFFIGSFARILREYERAVIFRLGRSTKAILNPGGQGNGPGLVLLVPLIDKMVKVSMQTVALDVPPQDVITRDNVSLKVNAVIYFRVVDPQRAVIAVQDYLYATSQIAQTTLRSVLGQVELDDLLSARDKINQQLQRIIDEHTEPWGIKVATVEVKQIDLPQDMQRAMAKQAEAERERRAKVINADGEFQAAAKLSEAAEVLTRTRSPSSSGICRRCARSPPSGTRRRSSRCRSTSSARCSRPSTGAGTARRR